LFLFLFLFFWSGDFARLGSSTADMTLVQLHLITRHGARVPFGTEQIPNNRANWSCFLRPLGTTTVSESDSVPVPGVLYRTKYIPNRETLQGNCAQGQLTAVGGKQHLLLGTKFREVYIEQLGFLDKNLTLKQLYVRSSDSPRTRQSAINFLTGLYPPVTPSNSSTALDLNTLESEVETLMVSNHCPKLVQLCNEVQQTDQWKAKVVSMNSLAAYLQKTWNSSSLPWWPGIWGNLESRQAENISYPIGITPEIRSQITAFVNWEITQMYSDKQRQILGIGRFLAELVQPMQSLVKNADNVTSPKFYFYSAHDTTIALVLSSLEAFDGQWPGFASNLAFELWNYSNSSAYNVRMLYNGNVVKLPACDFAEFCSFTRFSSWIQQFIPTNWQKQCETNGKVQPINSETLFLC